MTTLALIRRAAVEQYRWMSDPEFTREWALVQMAPGINLLGLAVLLGKRVDGVRGIVTALVGMLLPSVTLTICLTSAFVTLRSSGTAQAALRGILPATIGIGLLTSFQMAYASLKEGQRMGRSLLALTIGLLVGSSLLMVTRRVPVLLVLCVAGGIHALFSWRAARQGGETERKTA